MNSSALVAANAAKTVSEPINRLQLVAARNEITIVDDSEMLPVERASLGAMRAPKSRLTPANEELLAKFNARLINIDFMREGHMFRKGVFLAGWLPRFAVVDPFKMGNQLTLEGSEFRTSLVRFGAKHDFWLRKARPGFLSGWIVGSALALAVISLLTIGAPNGMAPPFHPQAVCMVAASVWMTISTVAFLFGCKQVAGHGVDRIEIPVFFKPGAIPNDVRALLHQIKTLGTVGLVFEATQDTYQLDRATVMQTPKPVRDPDPLIIVGIGDNFFLLGSFDMTKAEYRAVRSFTE